MKTLKLITAMSLMLIAFGVFNNADAQDVRTLNSKDSSRVYNVPSGMTKAFITVGNVSGSDVDSVRANTITGNADSLRKSPLSAHDVSATSPTTYTTLLNSGASGAFTTYVINVADIPNGKFELYRKDETTRVTRVVVTYK